ncbi:ornithine--oxo-acid transaminase [Myxococcota bacterium]|nr:ornithine--oxo-acid transaminase [Myxococcota bacterium]
MEKATDHIDMVEEFSAHNYHPLPVVIAEADGVWVTDVEGNKYLDMLAAYSAVNFGHSHRDLIDTAKTQLERVTLTSRAFHNDQFGPFARDLAKLCNKEAILPMNTGAEAVETAIKTARKWGYQKKGVAKDRAKIITCEENFHGRTTTIISFSTDPVAKNEFGPYTPGFENIPYGNAQALRDAIDEDTVAFLVEPIQGEAGVLVPPEGYLKEVREICTEKNILFIADEIQSGLGRTGHTFACDHDGVTPDIYILGKALGGGLIALSAIAADKDIMDVFKPGEHGSTFGGNPLACSVGSKVIEILNEGSFQKNAKELGAYLMQSLKEANLPKIKEIRGRGLWLGIEIHKEAGPARKYTEMLKEEGMLCKETHVQSIRLAPPLSINKEELDWAIERLIKVLK